MVIAGCGSSNEGPADDGCKPSCGDQECGDDGCGGACGECDQGSICTDWGYGWYNCFSYDDCPSWCAGGRDGVSPMKCGTLAPFWEADEAFLS